MSNSKPSIDHEGGSRSAAASITRLIELAARIVPHVPAHLGYPLCDLIGATIAPRMPAWPQVLANLRIVMPHADQIERLAAARRVMIGLFKNYFDLLRFHTLPLHVLQRTISASGFEHAERSLAQGRGLLIVAPHCGPYTIAFAPLVQRIETRVLVIVEQLADPRLHQLMNGPRQMPRVDIEPLGPGVARAVIRALHNKHAVILAGDRAIAENTIEVDFFGRSTPLPNGPATLALRTGTPLLTAFMHRLPDNRAIAHFDPPLIIDRSDNLQHDIRDVTQKIAYHMQTYISRDPSQWLVAERVWKDGG